MTPHAKTLALLGRYQLGALLAACLVARWRGGDTVGGVATGGGLVAANIWLSQRLLPLLARPAAAPRSPAVLVGLAVGKVSLQLGLAAFVLLRWPPPPLAFLAGLATFAAAAAATGIHLAAGAAPRPQPGGGLPER